MRVLFGLMALALWSQVLFAAGVLRPPSVVRPQRLLLQSFKNIAELQLEVDSLVARGYTLFAGKIQAEELATVTYKEFILIRDAQSPVYRYGEKVTAFKGVTPIVGKGIAEGWKVELGNDPTVDNDETTLYSEFLSIQGKRFYGWYNYQLKTADGAYPDTPAAIDALQLVNKAHTISMQRVNNYRVYRGKAVIPAISGVGSHIIETITVNGNNPYIVYRHTAMIMRSGKVIGERFSIGKYPHIAIDPFRIQEEAVVIEWSDVVGHSRYQLRSDDEGNITLKYGKQEEIPLQLIKQSDVWNEYEDMDETGAGVEDMLKRNYFNGESSN